MMLRNSCFYDIPTAKFFEYCFDVLFVTSVLITPQRKAPFDGLAPIISPQTYRKNADLKMHRVNVSVICVETARLKITVGSKLV